MFSYFFYGIWVGIISHVRHYNKKGAKETVIVGWAIDGGKEQKVDGPNFVAQLNTS